MCGSGLSDSFCNKPFFIYTGCLPHLKTLQISHNRLCSIQDIQHLTKCRSISVLDLSNNMIDDPGVLDIFASMTSLRVLNLSGNPMLKHMKNYRKNFIFGIKELCYLDDRPVTDQERACVNAWSQGGVDAERKERIRWKEMEEDKLRRSVEAVLALRKGRSNLDILLKLEKEKEILIKTVDSKETGNGNESVTNECSTIKDKLMSANGEPTTETINECLVSINSGNLKEIFELSQEEKGIRKLNAENHEDIPSLEDVDQSEFQLSLPDDQACPEENDPSNVTLSGVQEEKFTTDYQMDISQTFQDKENKLLIGASNDDSGSSIEYCTDKNNSSNIKYILKDDSDIKIEESLVKEKFIPRSEMSLGEKKANITHHSATESMNEYTNDLNAEASNDNIGNSTIDFTNKLGTIAFILNSLESSENGKDINCHESSMKECSLNNDEGDSVKGDNLNIQHSPNNEKEIEVQFDNRDNHYEAILEELHSKETIRGNSEIELIPNSENFIAGSEICKSSAEEKANITDSSETASVNEYANDLIADASNDITSLPSNESIVNTIDLNSNVHENNADSTQSRKENIVLQNEKQQIAFRPSEATEECNRSSPVEFANNDGDVREDESFAENNNKNSLNSFETLPQKENFEIETDASCISNTDPSDVRVDISRVQNTNYIPKYPITSCVLHRIQVTEDTDEDTATSMEDFTPSSSSYNSISEESAYSIPEITHQVPPQKIHALIDKAHAKLLSVSTCESDIDYNLIEGNRSSGNSNETGSTHANTSVYQNVPDLQIDSDLLRDISNAHFSLVVSNRENFNTLNEETMIQPAGDSSKIQTPEPAVNEGSFEEAIPNEATTSAIHGILSQTEQEELEEFIVQTQTSDSDIISSRVGASSSTMPETEKLLSEILLREYDNLTDEEKQNKFSRNENSSTTRQELHPPLEETKDEDVENDIWSILEELTNHKVVPRSEEDTGIELEEKNIDYNRSEVPDMDYSISFEINKSQEDSLIQIDDNNHKGATRLNQKTTIEGEEGYIDFDQYAVSDVSISTTFGLNKSEDSYMDKKQKDVSKPYKDTRFEPKGCMDFDYGKNPDVNILKKIEVNESEEDSFKNIEKERSLSFLEVTNDFFEPQMFRTENYYGFQRDEKIKSKPNTKPTKWSDHITEDEVWLGGCGSSESRNKLHSNFYFEQLNIETNDSSIPKSKPTANAQIGEYIDNIDKECILVRATNNSSIPKSKPTTNDQIGEYIDNSEEECILVRSNNRDSIFGGKSTCTSNRTFPKMCCLDLQDKDQPGNETFSAKGRAQDKKIEPLFKRRYLQENISKPEEQRVLIEELD